MVANETETMMKCPNIFQNFIKKKKKRKDAAVVTCFLSSVTSFFVILAFIWCIPDLCIGIFQTV